MKHVPLMCRKLKIAQVMIGKVDCTVATALCSAQVRAVQSLLLCSTARSNPPQNQDVTGYPTLKFFKNGAEKEDGVKYRGNRDAAALEKFIAEKLGHEVPEEKPAAPESAEVPRSQYLAFSHCTSL